MRVTYYRNASHLHLTLGSTYIWRMEVIHLNIRHVIQAANMRDGMIVEVTEGNIGPEVFIWIAYTFN